MRTFFWLDEDQPGAIRLFQMNCDEVKRGEKPDPSVHYQEDDSWPSKPPVGIYFRYGLVDEFMREWLLRQQELRAGEITRGEYYEWKLNWPQTCDDTMNRPNYIPWRVKK